MQHRRHSDAEERRGDTPAQQWRHSSSAGDTRDSRGDTPVQHTTSIQHRSIVEAAGGQEEEAAPAEEPAAPASSAQQPAAPPLNSQEQSAQELVPGWKPRKNETSTSEGAEGTSRSELRSEARSSTQRLSNRGAAPEEQHPEAQGQHPEAQQPPHQSAQRRREERSGERRGEESRERRAEATCVTRHLNGSMHSAWQLRGSMHAN